MGITTKLLDFKLKNLPGKTLKSLKLDKKFTGNCTTYTLKLSLTDNIRDAIGKARLSFYNIFSLKKSILQIFKNIFPNFS